MWLKKKSVLQADGHYDTEKSANGSTDMRTTYKSYSNTNSSINNSGRPSAADAGNYFYLPALGHYAFGQLYLIGDQGDYWSSSDNPSLALGGAYSLLFYTGYVGVYYGDHDFGMRVDWPK